MDAIKSSGGYTGNTDLILYLKILLVIITMGHLRAVDDCSGLLDICQLLNREGIADNILG